MRPDLPGIRYDVFISYARRDGSDYAAHLQADLEAIGLRVWRDTRDLDPNQDFTAEIENAIEASVYVVVCVTPDVKRENSFVRREIGYALACERLICVARMENVVPPVSIVNNTYADFFNSWEAAFTLLKSWIARPDKSHPAEPTTDPYRSYLKQLLLDLNETINLSVISKEAITLRAIESVGDVARKTHRLNPRFITHVLRDTSEADPIPQHFDSLHDAYAHARCDGRLLLLGDPGAGKTTTLLAFTRDVAAARLSDQSKPLPVFARIAGWSSYDQTPFTGWLAALNDGLTAPALEYLIERGEALLLLDGLDELGSRRPVDPEHPERGDYDPREQFLKALPPSGRVILSSRVEEYRQIGAQAALNCAVRLEPLDDAQMQVYLTDIPDLWQAIAADDSLKESLRTPLLLALVRVGFEGAPEMVRAIRNLSAGDLNDRIWDAFINKRWEHEQARQPDAPLPYTAAELKWRLGVLVFWPMAVDGNYRDDFTRFRARDTSDDSVIALAQRLDLLRSAGDEPVGYSGEAAESVPSYRFLHLSLRDALAYSTAMIILYSAAKGYRQVATVALGRLGDPRAVEPLIAALQDPDEKYRRSAARALARLGDARAVEPLFAMLQDPSKFVHATAFMALTTLGRLAVEPLIAALHDADPVVRYHAVRVLGSLGDARAVEPLIVALYDLYIDIRYSAAEGLGQLGDAHAVEPLIAALRDEDRDVGHNAARALDLFPDHPAARRALAKYKAGKIKPRGRLSHKVHLARFWIKEYFRSGEFPHDL